jgi:hypothetical protein
MVANIVAAETQLPGESGWVARLIRTDPNGNLHWNRAYDRGYEEGTWKVRQTKDGGFVLVGTAAPSDSFDTRVYLMKATAKGVTSWTRIYGGSTWHRGNSVHQVKDGGYIITGLAGYRSYLIKTDSRGETTWTRTYGDSGHNEGCYVQQTRDGGYAIVGQASHSNGDWHPILVKTGAAGESLWARAYDVRSYGDP